METHLPWHNHLCPLLAVNRLSPTLYVFFRAFWSICFRVKVWSTTSPSLIWNYLPRHHSNPQSIYGLCLLLSVHILQANTFIIPTFGISSPLPYYSETITVDSPSSGTIPLSKAILRILQIQSTTMLTPSSIISPVTSSLPDAFPFSRFPLFTTTSVFFICSSQN